MLRWWIDLHPNPIPAAEQTFHALRWRADWRTGIAAGSDTEFADDLGLTRKTFARHTALLSDLGLLVRAGKAKNAATQDAGWQVPEDAERWMRNGEPFPVWLSTVFALLVPEFRTWVTTTQHLSHHDPSPESPRPSTCVTTTQADTLSSGETGPVEVEEVKNLQEGLAALRSDDPSLVADVLTELSACLGETITSNSTTSGAVSRLLAGGWSPNEIVAEMRRLRKPTDNAKIWVTRLGNDLPDSPPRVKQNAERERASTKAAAPACGCGTPNGTYTNTLGVLECPLCRLKEQSA